MDFLLDFWILLPGLLCFGITGFFLVLTVVTGLVEKRNIWPYVPVRRAESAAGKRRDNREPEEKPRPKRNAYMIRRNEDAEDLEFESLGSFQHGKGGIYSIRYDF